MDIGHAQGQVAKGGADLIGIDAPVVGQLNLGVFRILAKANKGQRVFVLRVFGLAQQLHAHHLGVEVNGALQVAHPQHGVEKSHAPDCDGKKKGRSCDQPY